MYLPIIWTENIPLFRVYYLKIFVLSKVLNFVLLVPPVAWFTINLQTGHFKTETMRELFYYDQIYYEVYLNFFSNQFFQKLYFVCVLS